MKKEHIVKICEIQDKYNEIHGKIEKLNNAVSQLEAEQNLLHQNLLDIRNAEEELINKIEEEIGRKLTPEDLIAAITKINEPA